MHAPTFKEKGSEMLHKVLKITDSTMPALFAGIMDIIWALI